jgi:hypothetical protein
MPSALTSTPPVVPGQLVTVVGHNERMSGTVLSVTPVAPGNWEVRAQVLAGFGVATSRHVVDGAGREVGPRRELQALLAAS